MIPYFSHLGLFIQQFIIGYILTYWQLYKLHGSKDVKEERLTTTLRPQYGLNRPFKNGV